MSLEILLQGLINTGGTTGTSGTTNHGAVYSVPPGKNPSGTNLISQIRSVPPVPAQNKPSGTPEAASFVAVPVVPPVPAKKDKGCNDYYSLLTGMSPDDRRFCRQCKSFRQEADANYRGYCMVLREYQHDDIPRRCEYFNPNGKQPPLGRMEECVIRTWLAHIGEIDAELIDETLERCRDDLETRVYFLRRADEITKAFTPSLQQDSKSAKSAGTG